MASILDISSLQIERPQFSPVAPSKPRKSKRMQQKHRNQISLQSNEDDIVYYHVEDVKNKKNNRKERPRRRKSKPPIPHFTLKKEEDVPEERDTPPPHLTSLPSYKKVPMFSNTVPRSLPVGEQPFWRRDMIKEDIRINRMRLIAAKIEAREMVGRIEEKREKKAKIRRRKIRQRRKIEYHAARKIQNLILRWLAIRRWQKKNAAAKELQRIIRIHNQVKKSKHLVVKARRELEVRRATLILEDKLYRYILRRRACKVMKKKRAIRTEARIRVQRKFMIQAAIQIQRHARGAFGREQARQRRYDINLRKARERLMCQTLQKTQVLKAIEAGMKEAEAKKKKEDARQARIEKVNRLAAPRYQRTPRRKMSDASSVTLKTKGSADSKNNMKTKQKPPLKRNMLTGRTGGFRKTPTPPRGAR